MKVALADSGSVSPWVADAGTAMVHVVDTVAPGATCVKVAGDAAVIANPSPSASVIVTLSSLKPSVFVNDVVTVALSPGIAAPSLAVSDAGGSTVAVELLATVSAAPSQV